jgi:hypothetical protein
MPITKQSSFFKQEDVKEMKEIKIKKERTPREKKPKLSKVDKKVNIIKSKIGKMTGALGILKITNQERYSIIIRVDQKDIKKKQRIIGLFSCPNLEFIK